MPKIREQNNSQKQSDNKAHTNEQKGAPNKGGNRNMHFVFGLGFQITFGVLFVIALSFFFYYLDKNTAKAVWSALLAWVFIGLAVAFYIQQYIATPEPSQPQTAIQPEPRQLVRVEPQYLMKFYSEHTEIQAKKLAQPYVDKWLEVAGRVLNVSDSWNLDGSRPVASIEVLLELESERMYKPSIYANFTDENQKEMATLLLRDDSVRVQGQIKRISSNHVSLSNCELKS